MLGGINLLPRDKECYLNQEYYCKKQIGVVFGIGVFILSLWHGVLWQQINIVIKQTGYLRQQQFLLEQNESDTKQQQQKLQQVMSKIINLEQQQLWLIQVFENLHCGNPPNSQLTQLAIKGDGVKLFGKTDAMFGITQLLKTFAQIKNCSPPLVEKITRQGDDYNFILSSSCDSGSVTVDVDFNRNNDKRASSSGEL